MLAMLKKIFSFLFQNRKSLLLILSLTLAFFILRFPLDDWLEKNLRDLQKKSPIAQEIVFDSLKMKWLPPGLLFEDISFVYKNKRSYLDSVFISLSLKDWIALKKAFNFKIKKGRSHLFMNFQRKRMDSNEEPSGAKTQEIYLIKSFTKLIDLKDLDFLYPNMSGELGARLSYKGSVEDIENMSGELILNGRSVSLSELQLNTMLGPLNLPSIEWTQIELSLKIKEGELLFEKVELGDAADALKIRMRGSGAFNYLRRAPRLSSYNIELQIDIDKDREFGFLDLMFANYKEKKSDFYRYSVRLIGRGSQVPKIEKLEQF